MFPPLSNGILTIWFFLSTSDYLDCFCFETVSLGSVDWPSSHCADQAGFELRHSFSTASLPRAIKSMRHHLWLITRMSTTSPQGLQWFSQMYHMGDFWNALVFSPFTLRQDWSFLILQPDLFKVLPIYHS